MLSYTKGVGVGAFASVVGTINTLRHPIRTVKGIGLAIAHPISTVKSIGRSLNTWRRDFGEAVAKDPQKAAFMLGKVAGHVAVDVAIAKRV